MPNNQKKKNKHKNALLENVTRRKVQEYYTQIYL